MQAVNWTEVVATARILAPDVTPALWHEAELAMQGWSVAQEAAGYVVCAEDIALYARALAELALAAENARALETVAPT